MAPTRKAFKAVAGKFGSSTWRQGNAARSAGMARSLAIENRRQVRRSGIRLARRVPFNREKKYFDTANISIPFDNDNLATSTQCLNIVAQGDSVTNRIGKKIAMKAVQIKGVVSAQDETNNHCTMLLVYDRNPNAQAALALPGDVVTASGSGVLTNRDNTERFKIIRRWEYSVTGSATGAGNQTNGYGNGGSCIVVDEYVPLKGRETEWQATNTNGAVSSMVRGSLFLLCMGPTNAGGGDVPSFTGQVRLDYDD